MLTKKTAMPRRRPPRKRGGAETADKIKQIATSEPERYASATLLSREEKRQLILAHAAARRSADPVQIASMWLGVAVCAVVVVIGWWWVVMPQISQSFEQGLKPALAESNQTVNELSSVLNDAVNNDLIKMTNTRAEYQFQLLKDQATIRANARRAMEQALSGGSMASNTRDLFAPALTVTGTPAVPTQISTSTRKP